MPELPEVETVVRGLASRLTGRIFMQAHIGWPRTIAHPDPDVFLEQISGRKVTAVRRRGKYVVIELDRGCLLIHLKMSGRLQVVAATAEPDPYAHTVFDLDGGWQLRFRDVRKFGRVYLVDDAAQVTGGLGPEPLDSGFTYAVFEEILSGRSGRLKSLLLNQAFIAGIGNIYADEALHAARLHPLRSANSLTVSEQERLHRAIQQVLSRAVERRGTTLTDDGYRDAEGDPGRYQDHIAVYGRAGQPCTRCGAGIERMIVGGRSTHFCPRCQLAETTRQPAPAGSGPACPSNASSQR